MSDKMNARDKGFIRGVAWAIALADCTPMNSENLLQESGLKAKHFKQAEVGEYDMKVVRKVIRRMR